MRARFIALVSASLLLVGCKRSTEPSLPLIIAATPKSVSAGGSVVVELKNSGDSILEFHHNDFELQRKVSDRWSYVWRPDGGFDINVGVFPQKSLVVNVAIPPTAPSGTYRVLFPRIMVRNATTATERASNEFNVAGK